MDPVQDAENKLRDLVNSPRRSHLLRQDTTRWFTLCSALDAIGDTQLALRAFLEEPDTGIRSDGWAYLMVYGALQVLYVQQDAARDLAKCLGFELELPTELRAIRDSRNAAVGHPTRYGKNRSTAIARFTLTRHGFEMLVRGHDHTTEFRHVNVDEAAQRQTVLMGDLLRRGAEQLMSEELDHRRRFRERPLRGAFKDTLGYAFEKLSEGLREGEARSLAEWGLDAIKESISTLRSLLVERGLADVYPDSVGRVSGELDFAISRLRDHLNGSAPPCDARDVEIYVYFLRGKLRELEDLAQEIDEEYMSDEV